MEKNLTSGSVLKTVIYFSPPYLLSYFCRHSTAWRICLLSGSLRRGWDDGGLGRQSGHAYADGYDRWSGRWAQRFSSDARSARVTGSLRRAASVTRFPLFAGLSILLTGLLLTAVHGIIRLLSVPEEAVNGTAAYR